MYDHLEAKDCVRTSSRITLIENQHNHVLLKASDGSSVTADVVIGADGVRSCVRAQIDQFGDIKQKMRNTSCNLEKLMFLEPILTDWQASLHALLACMESQLPCLASVRDNASRSIARKPRY